MHKSLKNSRHAKPIRTPWQMSWYALGHKFSFFSVFSKDDVQYWIYRRRCKHNYRKYPLGLLYVLDLRFSVWIFLPYFQLYHLNAHLFNHHINWQHHVSLKAISQFSQVWATCQLNHHWKKSLTFSDSTQWRWNKWPFCCLMQTIN